MFLLDAIYSKRRETVFYAGLLAAATLFCSASLIHASIQVDAKLSQSYDTNVFQTRAGSLADQSSWITRFEPRLRWQLDDDTQLSYRLEAFRFWDASGEDHLRHHLGIQTRGDFSEAVSYRFSTTHLQVQGPADALVFDEGRSAFSTASARERRNQWQNRTQGDLRWDLSDRQFLRARGSLLYYDLNSTVRIQPRYDNWIDRYDINGALDWGTWLGNGMQSYVGLQRGYQHQGRQGGRVSDRSNHYHRLLFGLSGQVSEDLNLNLEFGPSRHEYRMGPGPLSTTRWFGNLTATWQVSEKDQLSANISRRRFVASTGNLANTISSYAVGWNHRSNAQLSWRLQGQVRSIEYDGVDIGDWLYIGRAGLIYTLESGIQLAFDFERTLGRDRHQSVPGREYNGKVFTFSGAYSF